MRAKPAFFLLSEVLKFLITMHMETTLFVNKMNNLQYDKTSLDVALLIQFVLLVQQSCLVLLFLRLPFVFNSNACF